MGLIRLVGNHERSVFINLRCGSFFAEHGIISSPLIAAAMSQIDRAHYVPAGGAPYDDAPQPIGLSSSLRLKPTNLYSFYVWFYVLHKRPVVTVSSFCCCRL